MRSTPSMGGRAPRVPRSRTRAAKSQPGSRSRLFYLGFVALSASLRAVKDRMEHP